MRTLDLELSGSGGGGSVESAAGEPDERVQALSSQPERTVAQCHEAQTIVQTYDQIVKRLKVRVWGGE